MGKTIIKLLFIAKVIALPFSCIKKNDNKSVHKEKATNIDEFKSYIANKPYTILYIWASWCGISRNGLINDYYENYTAINNDTVQSLLIIASDTVSINDFFKKNEFSLPYKYLYPEEYSLLKRNVKDEKNKDEFLMDFFNYKPNIPGFPSVILVSENSKVLVETSETKFAISNYRFFERQKLKE
ncbi:MAG: hypothetical protein RIC95_03605 [Vicingaceae bacterium]